MVPGLFGPGVDEPIAEYDDLNSGQRIWLHPDRQGSIIATSSETGAVTTYAYGPWGEVDSWAGPRFRYTGQIALPEIAAYYYKARVYDPTLGRFLQTDPIGQGDDPDLYAYVKDDPTDRTDPTGRYEKTPTPNEIKTAEKIATRVVRESVTGSNIKVKVLERVLETGLKVSAGVLGGAAIDLAIPIQNDPKKEDDENSHYVVRGGTCTEERFCNGSGVSVDKNGKLNGVSVQSFPRTSVQELSQRQWVPQNQIGVSTTQLVRQAGGSITPDPTGDNPYHAIVSGLTPAQAAAIFSPTIPNPNPK